jgi:hypothetical protein
MEKAFHRQLRLKQTNLRNRESHFDSWDDLFNYARNLNGNWQVSQEIFYNNLLPTAENDPKRFADCVDKMVRISGLKLKCSSNFFKTIRFLKRMKTLNRDTDFEVKQALTELFISGLNEPKVAKTALLKTVGR